MCSSIVRLNAIVIISNLNVCESSVKSRQIIRIRVESCFFPLRNDTLSPRITGIYIAPFLELPQSGCTGFATDLPTKYKCCVNNFCSIFLHMAEILERLPPRLAANVSNVRKFSL